MNKLQFAISLARRSGHLITGFDRVKERVERRERDTVLIATDLSAKSAERVRRFSDGLADVFECGLTQYDISLSCGKLTGILTTDDENMAVLFRKAMEQMKGEQ